MNNIGTKILDAPTGKTSVFFLGQSGFVFKSSKGTLLAVDLYLSDCVERYYGFKRLMPHLLEPNEIVFDYIVVTHWHYDHFDIDAMPIMLASSRTKLIATMDCKSEIKRLRIPEEKITYISAGESYVANDIKIYAVFCDHGIETPHAIGMIIVVDDKKIYIAGDTALRLDKAQEIKEFGTFDLMIAPINGAYGNLNEDEAVALCGFHKPSLFVPCHYWNFAEHGGNPGKFAERMKQINPELKYELMAMGESIFL